MSTNDTESAQESNESARKNYWRDAAQINNRMNN